MERLDISADYLCTPRRKVSTAAAFKGFAVKILVSGGIKIIIDVDSVNVVIIQYLADSILKEPDRLCLGRSKIPAPVNGFNIWLPFIYPLFYNKVVGQS